MIDSTQPAARFFWGVTARPKLVLTVSLALIVVAASFVPGLTKDTTADAFIAADNPAVVYRDKAKQIFGLEDPIVVAVVRDAEGGIYHPDALNVLRTLTEHIEQLDNIDPERVTSLWTESDIRGTADGMEVTKFYELGDHPADGDAIRAAIQNFPLYEGNLVARNGSATLVVAELIDQDQAQATYDAFLALVDSLDVPDGVSLHVAGEGAISGYLATYIDRDARRLNPMAAVVITIVLVFSPRSIGAMIDSASSSFANRSPIVPNSKPRPVCSASNHPAPMPRVARPCDTWSRSPPATCPDR
jgi:hypothetical protein